MLVVLRCSVLTDGWNKLAALSLPDSAQVKAALHCFLLMCNSGTCVGNKQGAVTVQL